MIRWLRAFFNDRRKRNVTPSFERRVVLNKAQADERFQRAMERLTVAVSSEGKRK